MILLILLTTFIFVFNAFVTGPLSSNQIQLSNPFFGYALPQIQFILGNFVFFGLGFVVILVFFVRSQKLQKHVSLTKKITNAVIRAGELIVLGFLLSYILLFFLAFLQLNIFAAFLNTNPAIIGATTDKKVILNSLKTGSSPPKIIVSQGNQFKTLLAVATATSGSNNLYGSYFLQNVPAILVVPIKTQNSTMILVDNYLILTSVKTTDIQTVSPVLAYLFIKQYFPTRNIKSFPKVAIMDRQEYVSYRKNDARQQLAKIDAQVSKIEATMVSISAKIQNDKSLVTYNQNQVKKASVQAEAQYHKCINAGTYTGGVLHHYYSESDCRSLLASWNTVIEPGNQNISDSDKQMQYDQSQLDQNQSYLDIYKVQRTLVQKLSENVPHELGVFKPPDSIRLELDAVKTQSLADYFETLTHEYFHYASYTPKSRLTDLFFEEGFTEYFARQTIKEELNTDTNLGYPVQVKIIGEIAKTIPESELADIYFNKDEAHLEQALDRVYGDTFYQDNETTFELLQYTSNYSQVLKLANDIMKKIGGVPLTKKDLYSSYSSSSSLQ